MICARGWSSRSAPCTPAPGCLYRYNPALAAAGKQPQRLAVDAAFVDLGLVANTGFARRNTFMERVRAFVARALRIAVADDQRVGHVITRAWHGSA